MVEIKEIQMTDKRNMMKFVRFPHKLFKGVKEYIPLLDGDEYNALTPKKNGAFEWSEARYWLAYKDGEIVGRIGAILNNKYNEKVNKKILRFTRYDFIDDEEVSKGLMEAVKGWAKELKCVELIGPIGFSDMDQEGMLIRGFDQVSMYITLWNYPYYIKHMEKMGFGKENDWNEYRISLPTEMSDPRVERLGRISELTLKHFNLHVRYFKSKKEIFPFIRTGLTIMNEVYGYLLGYTELSTRQMDEFIDNFGMVLNTDYLFAVQDENDRLVGYGFFAPSLCKSMKKCGGKLSLGGIASVVKDLTKNDTVDLYSIGVIPEYMGKGVNAIIMYEGIKACIKHGIKYAETGPELDINNRIQEQWKDFEKVQHKNRRCWKLSLEEKPAKKAPAKKPAAKKEETKAPTKKATSKKATAEK